MKSSVLGVVAGLATGALLGVLFAPDKGSKTRKKIKTKTNKAKDKVKQEFDDFLDMVSKKYNSIVDNEVDVLEKAKADVKKAAKSQI